MEQALVFERFYREEEAGKPGMGLGLPISRLLARQGGSVSERKRAGAHHLPLLLPRARDMRGENASG